MHAPYTLCKVNATIPGTEYACKISYVSAKFSNFNYISIRSFIPSPTEIALILFIVSIILIIVSITICLEFDFTIWAESQI